MRSVHTLPAWLPLLAAGALLWPLTAGAQSFTADYALSRSTEIPVESPLPQKIGLFELGSVRIGPAVRADPRFSGAGLSFQAGQNWFGEVGVGRSLQKHALGVAGVAPSDFLSITGGYRWSDGQSLSLQLTGGRGADRLGLSVSYDWPRYFVRLSYDARWNLVPQDSLRFSAGMRF